MKFTTETSLEKAIIYFATTFLSIILLSIGLFYFYFCKITPNYTVSALCLGGLIICLCLHCGAILSLIQVSTVQILNATLGKFENYYDKKLTKGLVIKLFPDGRKEDL